MLPPLFSGDLASGFLRGEASKTHEECLKIASFDLTSDILKPAGADQKAESRQESAQSRFAPPAIRRRRKSGPRRSREGDVEGDMGSTCVTRARSDHV